MTRFWPKCYPSIHLILDKNESLWKSWLTFFGEIETIIQTRTHWPLLCAKSRLCCLKLCEFLEMKSRKKMYWCDYFHLSSLFNLLKEVALSSRNYCWWNPINWEGPPICNRLCAWNTCFQQRREFVYAGFISSPSQLTGRKIIIQEIHFQKQKHYEKWHSLNVFEVH